MRKTVFAILALMLVLSMAMTAFAAPSLGNGGTDSAEVRATYSGKGAAQKVYSVDIAWEGLNFTYNGAFQGNWNPDTHQYDGAVAEGWAEGTGTVTVTNHSNTGVTATAIYAPREGYEAAGMSFSQKALKLATADNGVDGAAGTAVTGTITVTPTGKLPEGTREAVIGTITITVS